MLALVLFSSVVCLFAASYVTAAGVVWLINRFIFMLPFDLFAYFQCPFSTTCIEYGAEYKNWVWGGTLVIFLISGLLAPWLYHRLER
ncbi:MAG: hypothetical protein ACI4PW_06560 [Alphaproteobacteria bacterium]